MTWLSTSEQQPQVFYHGTRRRFDSFRPDSNGLIHFAQSRERASEFATHVRGGPGDPTVLDTPRVIEVHLRCERPFDVRQPGQAQWLMSQLDLDVVAEQAYELTSATWGWSELTTWIERGAWQMMELPAVLEVLKSTHDAIFMEELSQYHVAVLNPDQVHVLNPCPIVEPDRPRRRGP